MPRLHLIDKLWILDQPALGLSRGRVAPIRWRDEGALGTEAFAANGYRFAKWHGKPNS
jgi:hypothetical protein